MLVKINDTEYATIDTNVFSVVAYKTLVRYDSRINNTTIDSEYNVIYGIHHIASVRVVKPIIGDPCDAQCFLTVSENLVRAKYWNEFRMLLDFMDSLERDFFPHLLCDMETLKKTNQWHMYNENGNLLSFSQQQEMDNIMRRYMSGISFHKYSDSES